MSCIFFKNRLAVVRNKGKLVDSLAEVLDGIDESQIRKIIKKFEVVLEKDPVIIYDANNKEIKIIQKEYLRKARFYALLGEKPPPLKNVRILPPPGGDIEKIFTRIEKYLG